MTDVFISYAREDVEFVRELSADLEKQGLTVWWDRSIPTGKSFDEVIEEALSDAKCVIVIWSKQSINSRWVRLEAGEGMNRNLLFPILMTDVKIPLAFRNIQAANLINWNSDQNHPAFIKLVTDIKHAISATPLDIAPQSEAALHYPDIDGRKKIKFNPKIVGAVVFLIVVIATFFIYRNINSKLEKQRNEEIIAELESWLTAEAKNDSNYLMQYRRDFPEGAHAVQVDRMLAQLSYEHALRMKEASENANTSFAPSLEAAAAAVKFETGSGSLKESSFESLNEIAEILKNDSKQLLTVKCHTDNVGSPTLNQTLSNMRARGIMKYLENQGVSHTQIQAYGVGETEPIADNATPEGRAKNRRTDLKLTRIQ